MTDLPAHESSPSLFACFVFDVRSAGENLSLKRQGPVAMFDEFCSLVSSESPSGSTSINKLSRLVELCWRWYAHAVN